MTTTFLALAFGAMLTGGAVMIVVALTPARADLTATVHHLLGDTTEAPPTGTGWVRSAALPVVADRLGLARFAADLRLLDRSVEQLAAQKVGYGAVGLVFPSVLVALLAVAGITLPVAVPAGAGLVLGGVLFVLPDVAVRREAADARAALRRATGGYIDLIALERLSDAGTTEALERAAEIGDSDQFARIRDTLLRAQLGGRPAWAGLTDLSESTGVTELSDLADIMRVAGRDGAAVYATLRARAASLRTQLLTRQIAAANAASEHMVIPVSLLGMCFMALIAYPAFVRIIG